MKYLKKIFESNNFNSMTDEELEEKLHWLRTEYSEIFREITQIVGIQKSRKESSEEELTKDWPESIWDLDKFQLNWVLEHGHHTTSKHYEISHKYLGRLEGVIDSGFADTNQYKFSICTSYWMNEGETRYQPSEEGMKSLQLLIKNLKKTTWNGDSVTRFDILFTISDNYNTALFYYDENKVVIASGRYSKTEYKSLESAIKALVERDLERIDDEL